MSLATLISLLWLKNVLLVSSLICFGLIVIRYIKDSLRDNSIILKVIGVFMVCYFILLIGFSIIYFEKMSEETLIVNIGVYMFLCLLGLWLLIRNLEDNFFKVIGIMIFYIIVLVAGCLVFGAYYYRKETFPNGIDILSFNYLHQFLWFLIQHSLVGFINYPTNVKGVFLTQFFWGKFIDLFALGYILGIFSDINLKREKEKQ